MAKTPESDDFGYEDPLENLLDEESDEEFGLPEFKEHLADELTPAVLKDWTAQDFASIYVRFRPHLERHARRFLNNQTQVEEVVQDAFLYLMTTLPELDSELGVLKFLKWKTRLLALDVIRANSKRYMAPLDEQPDLAADLPEMGIELERAEDAAIVSLALAKLHPRHREALIASVYEEKSTEVVAAQLGLSENATRQLLFRARAAFKKALVGEAETAGLSISQILSLAAKKAAQESGKILGAAGAFLLVLAISLGVIPGLVPSAPEEQQVAESPLETTDPEITPPAQSSEASKTSGIEVSETEEISMQASTAMPVAAQPATFVPNPTPTIDQVSFASVLTTDVEDAGFYLNSEVAKYSEFFRGTAIEVFGGTGVSAFVYIDPASRTIEGAIFQIWADGQRYFALAKAESHVSTDGELTYVGDGFYVSNEAGQVFDKSALASAKASVSVKIEASGAPYSARLAFSK